MSNERPLISILIPTRDRPMYLAHCIATILKINDPRIEVVVSDNSSDDVTSEMLESVADSRLRVVRPKAYLAMTDNYEFGLKETKGDYVIVVGDDDGLVSVTWPILRQVIANETPEVINWSPLVYDWPSDNCRGIGGFIGLRPRHVHGGQKKIDAAGCYDAFRKAKVLRYRDGANIYHGCVSRAVIERVRNHAGRYFFAHAPDLGAAITNLLAAQQIVFLGVPVSIGGTSPRSSGAAHKNYAPTSTSAPSSFDTFKSEMSQDVGKVRLAKGARTLDAMILDGLFLANAFFGRDQAEIDVDRWVARIQREIDAMPSHVQPEQVDLVNKWLAELHLGPRIALESKRPATTQNEHAGKPKLSRDRISPSRIRLQTRPGFCENVFDAAKEYEQLCGSIWERSSKNPLSPVANWLELLWRARRRALQLAKSN